ncbi:MAG: polysaccharide biosynthesis/export family protein [Gallionella sp.]
MSTKSAMTPFKDEKVGAILAPARACILGLALFCLAAIMPNAIAANLSAAQAAALNSVLSGQSASALTAAISGGKAPAVSAAPVPLGSPASDTQGSISALSPQAPQLTYYIANQNSNVFGANLFTGAFTRLGSTQFNPDYAVALGDSIQVRLWGSFQFDSILNVDPEGNIFVPNVGPVRVLGVRNQDLQRVVELAIGKVYRSNVLSYSTLAAAQPVRVFVGGYVNLPGMYSGTSMDSLLNYLDQAGGIDPARGSFLNVQVKRGSLIRATFNLYDFLLQGHMPIIQLADGDVILVTTRQSTITVFSLAENPNLFEFMGPTITMAEIIKLAKPFPQANHVMVTRNNASLIQNTEYYPLDEAIQVNLQNGDTIQFTSDKKIGTISVRVQGEHESPMAYVMPHGARLGDLMKKIKFSDQSDASNIQLFRQSVQARQTQQLQSLLQSLQANILTARSGTAAEASLRTQEAALMLQWVDRAKQIQPTGQVLIAQSAKRDDLLLENGDVINIPTKDGLVMVSGQVLFPTTIAFDAGMNLDDYIRRCGGYTQGPDVARIIVAHRDGSFSDTTGKSSFNAKAEIREGDAIMVLPYVDPKSRQFWLEMTQIISQVAISAKIVLGL